MLASAAGIGAAAIPAIAAMSAAPDFTLKSVAGPNLRLREQRGQVVMINFWASWCGPCRQEMPELNKLYAKYRTAGFVIFGVNVDEDPRQAGELAQKLGLTFPVMFDADKKVSRLYALSTMPTTVLIDRDGRVRYVHNGYRNGFEDIYDKQIRELLK